MFSPLHRLHIDTYSVMDLNVFLTGVVLFSSFSLQSYGYAMKVNDDQTNHQSEYFLSSQNDSTYSINNETKIKYTRPIALKTNLLFDLATAINVEAELPIGKQYSVAGEWIFPWWKSDSKQRALQLLSGNLEARYWFKPNYSRQDASLMQHNPMTGWFTGFFGGGGLYDFEWNKKGYQGEFFIATGISGGYVASLSRNINMEFSLGVGIIKTQYRKYTAIQDGNMEWHLIKQLAGNYTWIGPLRAKVSLVWYPHFSKKRGH